MKSQLSCEYLGSHAFHRKYGHVGPMITEHLDGPNALNRDRLVERRFVPIFEFIIK